MLIPLESITNKAVLATNMFWPDPTRAPTAILGVEVAVSPGNVFVLMHRPPKAVTPIRRMVVTNVRQP